MYITCINKINLGEASKKSTKGKKWADKTIPWQQLMQISWELTQSCWHSCVFSQLAVYGTGNTWIYEENIKRGKTYFDILPTFCQNMHYTWLEYSKNKNWCIFKNIYLYLYYWRSCTSHYFFRFIRLINFEFSSL